MYVFQAYAGIGARDTPPEVLEAFEAVSGYLAQQEWTLRSGGAPGADTAFETGATQHNGRREIYLPWGGFNNNLSRFDRPSIRAFQEAEKHHPAWDKLKQGARLMMARNTHQIMGHFIERPVFSKFVLCWTSGGAVTGGTGQALRMARHYNIPVINLGSMSLEAAQEQILEFTEKER